MFRYVIQQYTFMAYLALMFWANFWGNDGAAAPAQCNVNGECSISHAKTVNQSSCCLGWWVGHLVLDARTQWYHLANMVERLSKADIVSHQGWQRGLFPNYLGPSCFSFMQTLHLPGGVSVLIARPSNTLYLPSKMTAWSVQPFLHGQYTFFI